MVQVWAETNPRPPHLRRATSREAARKRRRVESDIFGDMSRLLPLQPSIRQRLDKPSIIRLTLSYIRAHALLKGSVLVGRRRRRRTETLLDSLFFLTEADEMRRGAREEEEEAEEVLEETRMFLGVLEGFLMVLSTEGDMIFLSENVSQHMGLTQVRQIRQTGVCPSGRTIKF